MNRSGLLYTIILLTAMLGWPSEGVCQLPDFNVQILGEADGIRTSTIWKMARDKQGFLWTLSPRYIQRFDGRNLKRFEIKGEDVLDIVADLDGKIWVSTQNGVKVFADDLKGFVDVHVVGPPMPNKFNSLQVSDDNRVWIISYLGLFVYDTSQQAFVHHPLPVKAITRFYRKIFCKSGREFFIGDTHRLVSYNIKTRKLRTLKFEAVRAIVPFSEDILWVTNARLQVFEANFKTGSIVPIPADRFSPKLASGFIELNTIVALENQQYLVNTTQGCFKYDRRKHAFTKARLYHDGSELANDEIIYSYTDQEGTLWMLGQQGILFFNPARHTINWRRGIGDQQNGWHNNIKAITGDNQGNIWMATGSGITRLNTQTGRVKSFHPGSRHGSTFQYPTVQGLVFDGRNLLIGPGSGGPLIFDPKTTAFKDVIYPTGMPGVQLKKQWEQDYIYSIMTLASGDHLVLADLSCYLIEKSTYKIREIKFPGSGNIAQTAAQDRSGNTWIGTFNGLLCVDKNFKTIHSDSTLSPSRLVTSLLIRNDSTVWAGSVGLFEITKTKAGFKRHRILPELDNQQITMLYRDKSGKIWIGADDGLYRYTEDKQLEWFDIWDNVQNKQINPNSLFEAPDGMLYLGGNNGLNFFDPTQIAARLPGLNVLITDVRINQDDSLYLLHRSNRGGVSSEYSRQPDQNILNLDWNQNSIEIRFAAPYFQNASKIRYRYRMTGLDTGWVSNERSNSVRFSSLAPGKYSFTVAATLDGTTWHQSKESFQFTIVPPIWQRFWFIALVLVSGASAAYLAFRRRVNIIKSRQAKVHALESKAVILEKEKAMAMYDGLKQQLNPHFLFNSLTSLDTLIYTDPDLASDFLGGLSSTYRYILQNRDNELVPLSEEIRFAGIYIGLQTARFGQGLQVDIRIDDQVKDHKIAPVTLQNLIENAIKHNIIADDTPLKIDIFSQQHQLIVQNTIRKKKFVETSNRQGLKNLESFYKYLSFRPIEIIETPALFTVKIPLVNDPS